MKVRPLIRIESLSYSYPDGTQALDRVSFNIFENERVGLMGPNGAGKSTLILHLNGIIRGNGAVTVQGMKVEKKNLKVIRQKVGLVFQNPEDQLFCPRIFDDVAFGPRNLNISEEEVRRIVLESLESVGLSGFEERSSGHLSIGEKKRAAVATVYAMQPDILVFDEPAGSLDARGRREIIRLLKNLKKTQVIVSHDLELARELCDRIIVLYEGRKVADGKTEAVFSDAKNLESWGLLGQ